MTERDSKLDDAAAFGLAHLASEDIDPAYPVLRHLYALYALGADRALWATVLYTTFYDLKSGIQAFKAVPEPGRLPPGIAAMPTGVERRGLRGGRTAPFIDGLLAELGERSLSEWLTEGWGDNPISNYFLLWEAWQRVKGNGRWSAFKIAEILRRVHGLNIIAPDMRLKFCTGPLEGLRWLMPSGVDDDARAEVVRREVRRRGLHVDWEHLETVLCDFNSMRKGHYYVGHDIDLMLEQANTAPGWLRNDLMDARASSLPASYLGEVKGWTGRSKALASQYRDTGVVGDRAA